MKLHLFTPLRVVVSMLCLLVGDSTSVFGQTPAVWAKATAEMVLSSSIYDGYAYSTGAATDNFGHLYLTGNYEECTIYFDTTTLVGDSSSVNAFLVKYDSSGNVKWAVGSQNSPTQGAKIATDVMGNVIMTGAFSSTKLAFGMDSIHFNHHGFTNYFVAKFDSLGHLLWTKGGSGMGFGGSGVYDVKTDAAGNIYFLGSFGVRTITFGSYTLYNSSPFYTSVFLGDTSYYPDIFLVKFDPNGNVLWAKSAGGTGNDVSQALAVDELGNAYITGTFLSNTMQFDTFAVSLYNPPYNASIFVAKYNTNGTALWTNTIGCTGAAAATGIVADAYGNVYLAGGFDNSIHIDTTLTTVLPAHGNGFFVKLDTSGHLSWIKKIGDTINTNGLYLAYGAMTHHIYLSGTFNAPATLELDGLTLPQLDTNSWGSTGFIAEYNDSGDARCFVDIDLPNSGPYVTVDQRENIYMSGTFVNDLYIDPAYHFTNPINNSVFAARFKNCGVVPVSNSVKQINKPDEITLYPNPASDMFTVHCSAPPDKHATIAVYDLSGRLLISVPMHSTTTEVATNGLPRGMHLCKITLNGAQVVRKVVIE